MRETIRGTKFWKFDLDETIRELEQLDSNIILIQRLRDDGWSALDEVDRIYASAIITDDNYLVICESDFEPVEIHGQLYEPEELLEEFGLETLEAAGLVEDANAYAVQKYITEYELSMRFDIDLVALELLQDEYTFQEIVKAAQDLDIID